MSERADKRDGARRRSTEELLRESEDRLRRIYESAPVGIELFDASGQRVMANRAHMDLFGIEDAADITSFNLFGKPGLGERDRQRLMSGKPVEVERWFDFDEATRQGEYRTSRSGRMFFRCSFAPIGDPPHGFLSIVQDLTEKKEREDERLRHEAARQRTQKLESLGVLAGGIAHDFNNLLVGILGNAELALAEPELAGALHEYLGSIRKAALHASELTHQMLTYSGAGHGESEPIDLNLQVSDMLYFIEASVSKKADLTYHLEPDLPLIKADSSQLRQIILNLVTNASDAVEGGHALVTLETGSIEADEDTFEDTFIRDDLPLGPYVFLRVEDTGCGMDEETRARLFDPFYSTKFTGRGLGLATVLGIVRGHHGSIKVQSEEGRGTSMTVYFPADLAPMGPAGNGGTSAQTDWQAEGTVLVADDEDEVRAVAVKMLRRQGFQVLTAEDGQRAVEMFEENPDQFDLVVLDVTMPRMSGDEAFRIMREIRPDIPIVLTSGYSKEQTLDSLAIEAPNGFIQKPFSMADFSDVIRTAIWQPGS